MGGVSTFPASINGTNALDLDEDVGQSTTHVCGEDIWWDVNGSVRILQPTNGAALSNLGMVQFNNVQLSDLRNENYASSGIDGSDGNPAPGTVVAIRTSEGNYAKIDITSRSYDLEFTLVVYQ